MCYVCGKSANKIVHTTNCRYVKMMPNKNKKYFHTLKEAAEAGYVQCKYCAHIEKYLRREDKALDSYCRPNGVYYYFNPADGAIDVISRTGKWKIIVNGQKHFIWLYHKNNHGANPNDLVPGFHSQKVRRSSLMGYMEYIVAHDQYRTENPLYDRQVKQMGTGAKARKNTRRREKKMRRTQSIRYVMTLLDSMSDGVIAY